jgi:hypothetical protein
MAPYIEGVLTAACIQNGHFDFPFDLQAKGFFPADTYATREKDPKGKPISLKVDGQVRSTDIRVKSSLWISPRARYGGLMQRLKCKPGDKVRIYRRGVREYELEFLPERAAGLVD